MTVELKAIGGYAPGNYYGPCRDCKNQFVGSKRSYQCHPCATTKGVHTTHPLTPAPAELVRFDLRNDGHAIGIKPSHRGPYVRHDQAAALIAEKETALMSAKASRDSWKRTSEEQTQRAEAAEAKLAQIKAQLKDPNAVHIALLRGDISKPSVAQINHIYAAPVASEAETIERCIEVVRKMLVFADTTSRSDIAIIEKLRALKGATDA